MKYLAQKICAGGQCVEGPLSGDINTIGDLINKILTFLIPIAVIILFFILVWGGIDFLTSQGNPEKIKSGRSKITAGIIGFVLFLLAFLITRILASIFGVGQEIFGS